MAKIMGAFKRFLRGYSKSAVFAVTTACNCKCIMCNMHEKKPEQISLEDAKKVLDFLAENKFLIAYITGGEPTLHPDIVEIVDYSNRLGLVTTMTTNGTADKKLLRELKDAGLYVLSVSLDHWNPSTCEKIRNHKNIMSKQVETIKYLKEIGVRTYALAFLNPFLIEEGVEKLMDYVNGELGVPFGFCYPTKTSVNTYGLGGVLSDDELHRKTDEAVKTIFDLKKRKREIANLYTYVEDLKNSGDERRNFYCRGGQDVVYIDWLGDVYPCFLKEKLFNILSGDEPRFLKNVRCNDCFINCFREPSFLPNVSASSSGLVAKEVYYSYSTRGLFK